MVLYCLIVISVCISAVAGGQLHHASGGIGHVPGGWHGKLVDPFYYDPIEECYGEDGDLVYCPSTDSWDKTFCCGKTTKQVRNVSFAESYFIF